MEFVSAEKTEKGVPLLSGLLVDFADFDVDDEQGKQEKLAALVQKCSKTNRAYRPPYIVMDLAEKKDIELLDLEGSPIELKESEAISEGAKQNPALKVVLSCHQIVDMAFIANPGHSIVRANPCVPVFRWFQAANLIYKTDNKAGRVIPFPLDQDKDETVFHMLRVTPQEYALYDQILDFSTRNQSLEEGFLVASRFSYEVLRKRGVSELTSNMVDQYISHVMLMPEARLYGVLVFQGGREDLEDIDFRESHFIFY